MLTLAQQYALDDCLRQQNRLTNEDLILELTDHFTLSLEQQMANGISFETALTTVLADFGGRKELQQLERRYNGVTFGRYTAIWMETISKQFKMPALWRTVAFFCFVFCINAAFPGTQKTNHFFDGISIGLLGGLLFISIRTGNYGGYVVSLFRHGYHNPPTEMQYVFTRVLSGALLLSTIGEIGVRFTVLWPLLLHSAAVALYYTSVMVYMNSYSQLNSHLYTINPSAR